MQRVEIVTVARETTNVVESESVSSTSELGQCEEDAQKEAAKKAIVAQFSGRSRGEGKRRKRTGRGNGGSPRIPLVSGTHGRREKTQDSGFAFTVEDRRKLAEENCEETNSAGKHAPFFHPPSFAARTS